MLENTYDYVQSLFLVCRLPDKAAIYELIVNNRRLLQSIFVISFTTFDFTLGYVFKLIFVS